MRGSQRVGHGIGSAALVAVVVVAVVGLGVKVGFVRSGGGVLPFASVPVSVSSAAPTRDPAGPRFPIVTRSSALIDGISAKVYLPLPGSARRAPERYPVAVFVPAPGVDPAQYEQLAHDLGGYGLAVVVPSRAPTEFLREVRAWADGVNADPGAPAQGLLDPSRLFVVSDGLGAPRLSTPSQVRGVAVYSPGARGVLRPSAVPTVVVCGSKDPAIQACEVAAVSSVVIDGAGARAITNQARLGTRGDTPPGAAREATIARFAQWTALWLLASVGDAEAVAFYASSSATPPPGVRVRVGAA